MGQIYEWVFLYGRQRHETDTTATSMSERKEAKAEETRIVEREGNSASLTGLSTAEYLRRMDSPLDSAVVDDVVTTVEIEA